MDNYFTQGHALLIGVGADLPNTADDAAGLANILKDSSRCAYPPKQIHLLTDKQASRDAILKSLDILAHSTDAESTVIIYFSGHGYRVSSSDGESYYLMPYGYNINLLHKTAISGAEFIGKLRAIQAQKAVLILDCCHAGGVGDAKSPGIALAKAPLPPEARELLTEGNGRVLIASSREDELSYAGKPYSAFTLALIETLCGIGVAKKDGHVRVNDLALHAREVVPKRTDSKQHPILDYERADNFVLAYYAGGDPQPKGLPFTIEPVIESDTDSQTDGDQPGTMAYGPRTNITGNANGPVLSGNFQGPVEVGRSVTASFYQPDWKVQGNVYQAQGDMSFTGSKNGNQSGDALTKIFSEAAAGIKKLAVDDQAVIKPLLEQIRTQAERIQQGEQSVETQTALNRRLQNLRAIEPAIANAMITALANPTTEIAAPLQKIAAKIQNGE